LTGRTVSGHPGDSDQGIIAHLKVSVRSPLYAWDISKRLVAVRATLVSRIVLAERARGPLEPGTITFLDGRRVKVKAMRWTTWGIRALTEEDIVIARWSDLAEVHPPHVNVIDALIEDLTAPCSDPESLFARLITEHGAVLTYRHKMMQIDHKEAAYGGLHHTVQPGWALDAIRVAFDSISKRSFWRADEIPLSLLPAQALSERSYTGFIWHWRRNTNVRGTDLLSGRFVAHLGIGTHSASQIAFQLPPAAKQFSSWVGIDRAVGNGGCVGIELYRDEVKDKPIWKSDFIRGGSDPVRLNAINIDKSRRLVLVTGFGHKGRPNGADPLDIRDEVNWMRPMVRIDRNALPRRPVDFSKSIAVLDEWNVSKQLQPRIRLRPYWDKTLGRWQSALFVDGDKQKLEQTKRYEFTRKIRVSALNAWLDVSVARDDNGPAGHVISIEINGKPLSTIMNGNPTTHHSPGHFDMRRWSLGPFVGKEITVAVVVTPKGDKNRKPSAVLWKRAGFSPIILDLPADGKPIKPQIPITSLKPTEEKLGGSKNKLIPGKLANGKPLQIRAYAFKDGYGVPGNSMLTYKLDPKWRRFVAVIGLADGTSIGPYRVMLDDKQIWPDPGDKDRKEKRADEKEIAMFDRQAPGRQLNLMIPPGHKTISLHAAGKRESTGVWAQAGFLEK